MAGTYRLIPYRTQLIDALIESCADLRFWQFSLGLERLSLVLEKHVLISKNCARIKGHGECRGAVLLKKSDPTLAVAEGHEPLPQEANPCGRAIRLRHIRHKKSGGQVPSHDFTHRRP